MTTKLEQHIYTYSVPQKLALAIVMMFTAVTAGVMISSCFGGG